jgi:multiple sugar transport system permease protein
VNTKRIAQKLGRADFWSGKFFRLLIYILLFDLAFVFLFPFLYMVITSLKSSSDLMDTSILWIPKEIEWKNYRNAYYALQYGRSVFNSAIVTSLSIFGHLASCSLAAYAFARYSFKGRDALFLLVLLSIIVPAQVIIVPLYIQFSKLDWLGTYLPLVVPTFFGFGLKGALFIFIFRQFFVGLPPDLENAARIDGCGGFRTYLRIILPISKAAILVVSVLAMVWHWNDYFEPNLYLTKPKLWLVPQMLPAMYDRMLSMGLDDMSEFLDAEVIDEGMIIFNEAVVLAGTFLVILPIMIPYFFVHKYFQESIARTGLTE